VKSDHLDMRGKAMASVSVVVPCFRCSDTIGRAVASIVAQTCRPQEILLVDDASGDDTLATLYALQREHGTGWIKVVAFSDNAGASSARNAGWNAAMGDYIAFLDADDAWHPHKIEIQRCFMNEHPEYALTGHDYQQVTCLPDRHSAIGAVRHKTIHYRSLLLSNRFITPSVMLRRGLSLRFHEGKRHMEDFLLWLEIAASGRQLACLECELAYIFKAPFGESGLSAEIVAMEKGELDSYRQLYRQRLLSLPVTVILLVYSCLKFLRRIGILAARRILKT
jgi:glycosyltransferase involved in cell wall biosynthesis